MKLIISSLALLIGLAACSTYDPSGAGATSPYGDNYDYRYESSAHNSAL